jgi:hypothetical protein
MFIELIMERIVSVALKTMQADSCRNFIAVSMRPNQRRLRFPPRRTSEIGLP